MTMTDEAPTLTYSAIAERSGRSTSTVGKAMRGEDGVSQEVREEIAEAVVALGGEYTDVPVVPAPPYEGELVRWKSAGPLPESADELRAISSRKAANRRNRVALVKRAELAGLSVEQLEEWCMTYVGGPHAWTGRLIKIFSKPEFAWYAAHLTAWVEDQVPEEHKLPHNRYNLTCKKDKGGCGKPFVGATGNKNLCPDCEEDR